ncbi:MAG TPA: TRAM domain-containing protein [Kofleriaceae bacterium]|nr:TRAM domain-containing protein [Kofleriaceae bacterium]
MTAPELELLVESLAAGGDAVARADDGRVVFLPYAAPGERVRARLVEEHRQYARAELVDVLSPAAERVEPPCPLFRERSCGGCVWQHVAYPVQTAAKQAIAASALRRAIARGLDLLPIEAPVEPYRWRRRARLHWVRPPSSPAAVIGLYAPRSHRVTDVGACPQLEPALEGALEPLHRLLAPGLFQRGEIDMLASPSGEVQVAVRGPCRRGAAEALPGQGGVVGVILGRQIFGAAAVEIEPGQWGQADRFAQASRAGNQALRAAVDRAARPREGSRVLELHSGSGNLTQVLADQAARVLAVDARPGRPLGGPGSAGPGGHPRVEWRPGSVEEVTADLAGAGERFDMVVLDPPREGARPLCQAIAALEPRRIVYVSCDPATLARDLDQLDGLGYAARWAQPIDIMPQTSHVELVVAIERAGATGTA